MRTGPVIPVIVIDELEDAVPLARALVAGGVRVLEADLAHAGRAARRSRPSRSEVEGAIVGVGTITRPEDFDAARQGRRACSASARA